MIRSPFRTVVVFSLAIASSVGLLISSASPGMAAALRPAMSTGILWGSGAYALVSRSSGLCLDIAKASQQQGAVAIQYPCTGNANQYFEEGYVTGWGFAIRAMHSGQCLEVRNASHDNGTWIDQWPCTGNANQLWLWQSAKGNGGRQWLINVESGKCIDVPYDSRASGVVLQQWTCRQGDTSYDNQIWDERPIPGA